MSSSYQYAPQDFTDGRTPLHEAVLRSDAATAEQLLVSGAAIQI